MSARRLVALITLALTFVLFRVWKRCVRSVLVEERLAEIETRLQASKFLLSLNPPSD